MVKKGMYLVVAIALVFSLSGCATFCKKTNSENQGLKDQVSSLETQIQEKDTEIASLKEALTQAEAAKVKTNITPANRKETVKFSISDVQSALKNAGYNPGAIDGKMGKQTKEAIRSFQRGNGLVVDGKMGKTTWELLKRHLSEKSK